METYTKGPWETSHHRKMETIHNPNHWTVKVHEFPYPPYEGELEEEWGVYPPLGECGPVALVSGEANARLIAAAPALLEALSVIVLNAVIGPDAKMNGTTDCYHVPIDDIDNARALLKSAKGE